MPHPPEPPPPPDEPTAPAPAELTLRPIGFVRTGKQVKFAARHQPEETQAETNVVELLPGRDLELALRDLAGFSRVWLIWWFHRNRPAPRTARIRSDSRQSNCLKCGRTRW